MTLARMVLDLWMIGVTLSVAGITLLTAAWLGTCLFTVLRARRRDGRRLAGVEQLRPWYGEEELASLDEALERVLAEERGPLGDFRAR